MGWAEAKVAPAWVRGEVLGRLGARVARGEGGNLHESLRWLARGGRGEVRYSAGGGGASGHVVRAGG